MEGRDKNWKVEIKDEPYVLPSYVFCVCGGIYLAVLSKFGIWQNMYVYTGVA